MARVLAVAVLFLLTVAGLPTASSQAEIEASVLIDFGDGYAHWADVTLEGNRTAIKATELAGEALGMAVEVVWGTFGAFVADIDHRNPPPTAYWALYSWDSGAWSPSSVGPSALELNHGDAIGWVLTGWDANFNPLREPEGTPEHRNPIPAFRGDQGNRGESRVALRGGPTLRWSFDSEAFEIGATPVASRGAVYLATFGGTYALSLDTGSVLWSREDVAGMSTPAIYNGNILLGARDGRLHFLNGQDGSEIWNLTLIGEEYVTFAGVASSPKIVGATAYVGAFNESGGEGGVYAVSVEDGAVLWRYPTASVHMSSPALHGGILYVGVAGRFNSSSLGWSPPYGLLALNASDGSLLWFTETADAVVSSPSVNEDAVVFTSKDGHLYSLAGDTGTLRWKRAIGTSTSSPAVSRGTLYAASGTLAGDGFVYAFDADGQELWNTSLSGGVQSSVAVAGDHVYATTNEAGGKVVCLSAKEGEVFWSIVPEPQQFILSSPVLTDGTLLVASDNGILYAYGGGSPLPPLSATAEGGPLEVVLSWTPPRDDGGSAVTGYRIYRGLSPGNLTLLTEVGPVLTYVDTDVVEGTTYYYEVRAVNAVAESPPSGRIFATPEEGAENPPPDLALPALAAMSAVLLALVLWRRKRR